MKFKKILSLILVFTLVFIQLPTGVRANIILEPSKSIEVGDVVVAPTSGSYPIYIGGGMKLSISFIFNKENISNPRVKLLPNDNFSINGSSEKNIQSNKATFNLVYEGGGNKLDIEVSYKDNKTGKLEKVKTQTITIDNLKLEDRPSDSGGGLDPVPPRYEDDDDDEDKDIPNISVVGNKTVLGEAGESVRLPIKIENTGNSRARDISASISLEDSTGVYIDGSGYDSVSRLSRGSDKTLSFRLRVDKFAEEKTYPINIKFNYYNQYDRAFKSEDTVYLKVTGDGNDQQIIVDDVLLSPDDNILPGSKVIVGFYLRNLSIIPARDVKLSIDGLEKDGFSLDKGTNKSILTNVGGRSTAFVQFPVKVSQKLKNGNHQLKLKLSYKNLRGQVLEDDHQFFIPVKGASKQNSNLIIENIKSPKEIKGNVSTTVSFQLRNRGQNPARDIVVTADLADSEGLVPKSVSTIKFDSIEPGEKETLSFNFYSLKDAPTRNYPINIKVEHTDDFKEDDEVYELSQFIGIFVNNPEGDKDAKKSVPKLIIDKYSFSQEMVEAGKKFDMNLSFYNTNSSKPVKNIKIFLTAEPNISDEENTKNDGSSVFTPVNSSNTFYIDSIPPKGRIQKSITMFTIPSAAAKTHTITANFEYEDSDAEEYKATELIGVPVIQQSKLEVAELNYFPEVSVGEPAPISSEFYNTGKVTLYNMMVRLEGDFQSENGTFYIGNFAPGTSEYFDASVIPDKPGILKGDVVFSFEDSTGEVQEERRPFSLNVSEAMEDPFMDDFPEEEPKGFFSRFKLPIIILALGLAFFGFKFYKKRKRAKEDEDVLDE